MTLSFTEHSYTTNESTHRIIGTIVINEFVVMVDTIMSDDREVKKETKEKRSVNDEGNAEVETEEKTEVKEKEED